MFIPRSIFQLTILMLSLGSLSFAGPAVKKQSGFWTDADQKRFTAKPKTEIRGNVLSTEESSGSEKEVGMQVRLATEGGEMLVHVGPSWFLSKNAFNLTQGEPITVIGIRISLEKKNEMLASEIRRGKEKLILREPTGKPRW